MSIIILVQKAGKAVIAADTMSTFGDNIKVSATYTKGRGKIFQCGDSFLGVCGAAANNNVLASIIEKYGDELVLSSKDRIFETSLKLHEILEEEYFINTAEDDYDSYKSSQLEILIANPFGIFGLYSWREVYEFDHFWAIGSGMEFALGAMYVVYDQLDNAEKIAETGIKAACEFDNGSGLPMTIHSVKLKARMQ